MMRASCCFSSVRLPSTTERLVAIYLVIGPSSLFLDRPFGRASSMRNDRLSRKLYQTQRAFHHVVSKPDKGFVFVSTNYRPRQPVRLSAGKSAWRRVAVSLTERQFRLQLFQRAFDISRDNSIRHMKMFSVGDPRRRDLHVVQKPRPCSSQGLAHVGPTPRGRWDRRELAPATPPSRSV
jgi:hypothetical protein